jgi:hypothetical protein
VTAHRVIRTAHRIELAQIYEINEYLAGRSTTKRRFRPIEVHASDLGLEGAPAVEGRRRTHANPRPAAGAEPAVDQRARPLPAAARLRQVVTTSTVSLPTVFGLFQVSRSSQPLLQTTLTTEQLAAISERLLLHHRGHPGEPT